MYRNSKPINLVVYNRACSYIPLLAPALRVVDVPERVHREGSNKLSRSSNLKACSELRRFIMEWRERLA